MESKSYTIQSCPVAFPVKPYPSQMAMMDRIIKSLNNRENCLVESPTGSGKSLALLCSALAWQRKEHRRILTEETDCKPSGVKTSNACVEKPAENGSETCCRGQTSNTKILDVPNKKALRRDTKKDLGVVYIDEDKTSDLEDFRPSKKVCLKTSEIEKENNTTLIKNSFIVNKPSLIEVGNKQIFVKSPSVISLNCSGDVFCAPLLEAQIKPTVITTPKLATKKNNTTTPTLKPNTDNAKPIIKPPSKNVPAKKSQAIPKIYFGTRTHKQVSQIVRELNKTAYKDVPLCILASRDKTCINHAALNAPNVNEACQELLDTPSGAACTYYHKANKINHFNLALMKNFEAWDIEDLVKFGSMHGACPYYAIRSLLEDAHLIITPYNYITDPAIRSAMNINLKNSIIILDEAHNLEDVSREAASLTLTLDEMTRAVKDLEQFAMLRPEWRSDALDMCKIFSGLCAFIKSNEDNLNEHREFDRGCKIWTGENLLAILCNVGAGPDSFKKISKFNDEIQNEKTQNKENKEALADTNLNFPKASKYPTSETSFLLKKLSLNLSFLFMFNNKYLDDFKGAVVKTASNRFKGGTPNQWRNKNSMGWEFSLNIWCLNPGVAFANISSIIHSLIVTSGTLSPMDSFESELMMKFPLKLEANHVIKKSQVWVGTISKGPQGKPLKAVYKNMDTFDFQDELGYLVLEVCKTIPDGVLCFVPSYSTLDKLTKRWADNGILDEIADNFKVVIIEPRGIGSKEKFDTAMKNYYNAIEEGEGGLFLAVCRGKVSEGLDFADKNARAVITVGIPFPNFKDVQVDLKMKYNNFQRNHNNPVLSGNDWYEMQAFRALNQALGRCIRHKTDWGALIIVDERFQTNKKYVNYLSKWVRSSLNHYNTFEESVLSLKRFTEENESNEGTFAGSYFTQNVTTQSTPLMDISTNATPQPISLSSSHSE